MKSAIKKIRAKFRNRFPSILKYSGVDGQAWFFGTSERAPSIAEFICGDGTSLGSQKRIRRSDVLTKSVEYATGGAVSILCMDEGEPGYLDHGGRAIEVPLRVVVRKALPDSAEALMAELKNSTTREDLRRIRKAGFTFRVTKNPEDVRAFYANQYAPLVRQRFPDDGTIMSLKYLLNSVENGGELVCADLDGEWVAGLFNWVLADNYAMGPLGIRDADEAVRQKRVVSALLVASMERAVELGKPTATLGFSLPFLGKGPIWFKAKWGCTLEVGARERKMQMFLDLRHAPVRKAIAESPIIHYEAGELVVSTWLPPGEAALKTIVREVKRFPGIPRWHVFTAPETLALAQEELDAADRILPLALDVNASEPLWLGLLISAES